MYNISYKYKQFWFLVVKLTIVVGAGFFIYKQLWVDNYVHYEDTLSLVKNVLFQKTWILPALLGLTLINWLLEIIKWQTLTSSIQKISFHEAIRQRLSLHTLSLITPFKMGKYGGKTLCFPKNLRKKALLLNFIGNTTQLLIILIFGIVGLHFFLKNFDVLIAPHKLRGIGYFLGFLILILFSGNKLTSYGKVNYYQKAVLFLKKIETSDKVKILFFSMLRYLIFSHQFFLLIWLFGVEVDYQTAILLIITMYFLATMLPVLGLFDFMVKGSIAIYLFSFIDVNQTVIILISILMWFFNLMIPALFGGCIRCASIGKMKS